MRQALMRKVEDGHFLAQQPKNWTTRLNIFVNRDAEVNAIGRVFLHNHIYAVADCEPIAELLGVTLSESLWKIADKPMLSSLRQPSGTGKSALAGHVSFVLQRRREEHVDAVIAAKLDCKYEVGKGNAVVQALKQWKSVPPKDSSSTAGPRHEESLLVSGLVSALSNAVSLPVTCVDGDGKKREPIAQILCEKIAAVLGVQADVD
ncbi:MAG: hypothetical protein EOO65_05575, partial [Methanosarcinales archaeon]